MKCPKCKTEMEINPGYKPYCPKCKEQYDMSALSLKASKKRQRNIYCPKCGYRVGVLN